MDETLKSRALDCARSQSGSFLVFRAVMVKWSTKDQRKLLNTGGIRGKRGAGILRVSSTQRIASLARSLICCSSSGYLSN